VGLIVVNGHKPSLNDLQTDSMGGWLGCCCNRDSNLLTLIGVTILKRSGQELMVVMAAMFFSSDAGTEAKGGAVSVDIAEGVFLRVFHVTRGNLVSILVIATIPC